VQWVFYYSASPILVAIFYSNFSFLAYLIGPVNYWYVRSMINDDYRLKRKDLWHLVPSLIILLTLIPYMFTPWTEKMRVASGIIDNLYYLIVYEPTIIHRLFRNGLIYLSRDLHIFIYLLFTIPFFVGYFRHARKKNVIFGQRYMIKWMIVFQFFFFLMVAGHIMVMSHAISHDEPDMVYAASKLQMIAIIGLTGLLVSPFFFPEILYGLPRIPNRYVYEVKGRKNHRNHSSKKTTLTLEEEYLDMIEQKADQYMTDQKPYLQKDFNLTELSVLIHVPVHHLAYYFRERKKQSFTNYRNRFRVIYAKSLIMDGKAREMTLEAIGILSGFANRNAFITAFKREERVSPHEYLSGFSKV
jgi:AraC-like DNA-binding protein